MKLTDPYAKYLTCSNCSGRGYFIKGVGKKCWKLECYECKGIGMKTYR